MLSVLTCKILILKVSFEVYGVKYAGLSFPSCISVLNSRIWRTHGSSIGFYLGCGVCMLPALTLVSSPSGKSLLRFRLWCFFVWCEVCMLLVLLLVYHHAVLSSRVWSMHASRIGFYQLWVPASAVCMITALTFVSSPSCSVVLSSYIWSMHAFSVDSCQFLILHINSEF